MGKLFGICNVSYTFGTYYLVNYEEIWMVNIIKYLVNEKMEKVAESIIMLFGVYLLIQIVRKILGGS